MSGSSSRIGPPPRYGTCRRSPRPPAPRTSGRRARARPLDERHHLEPPLAAEQVERREPHPHVGVAERHDGRDASVSPSCRTGSVHPERREAGIRLDPLVVVQVVEVHQRKVERCTRVRQRHRLAHPPGPRGRRLGERAPGGCEPCVVAAGGLDPLVEHHLAMTPHPHRRQDHRADSDGPQPQRGAAAGQADPATTERLLHEAMAHLGEHHRHDQEHRDLPGCGAVPEQVGPEEQHRPVPEVERVGRSPSQVIGRSEGPASPCPSAPTPAASTATVPSTGSSAASRGTASPCRSHGRHHDGDQAAASITVHGATSPIEPRAASASSTPAPSSHARARRRSTPRSATATS